MPRFFFDVYDGRAAMRDEVGAEMDSLTEAYDEAASLLPEFAREALPDGQSRDFGAAVRDESGKLVYRAVLIFRGDTNPPERPASDVEAAGAEVQLMRAASLRQEAKKLGKRLTDNIEGLLAAIEASSANIAASRKARGERSTEEG